MSAIGRFDGERKFGVEIEATGATYEAIITALRAANVECVSEGYHHTTRSYWKLVSDASVRGVNAFELVSPPLKGEAGLAELKRALKALSDIGATVNNSCGLHVHHDASDLDIDAIKATVTSYWKYEDVIAYFLSPSRRANCFARPCAPRGGWVGYSYERGVGIDEVAAWKRAMHQIRDRRFIPAFQPERYAAVNLRALERHGTIEFRAHQGTLEYKKVEAWIVLTQWLVTRAKLVGCKVTKRLTGKWAEATRFFFRNIGWYNLECPVTVRAKGFLRRRFNEFKAREAVAVSPRVAVAPVDLGGVR